MFFRILQTEKSWNERTDYFHEKQMSDELSRHFTENEDLVIEHVIDYEQALHPFSFPSEIVDTQHEDLNSTSLTELLPKSTDIKNYITRCHFRT